MVKTTHLEDPAQTAVLSLPAGLGKLQTWSVLKRQLGRPLMSGSTAGRSHSAGVSRLHCPLKCATRRYGSKGTGARYLALRLSNENGTPHCSHPYLL